MRVTNSVAIPLAEVELRVSRSSGPGGQHANVTASRVEAVFDVHASAALSEDQKARLAARLGHASPRSPRTRAARRATESWRSSACARGWPRRSRRCATPPRRPTRPRRRRVDTKRRRGEPKRTRRRPRTDDW